MSDVAFQIVNALVKDKQAFEHMKKSIAWRLKDAELVDINEVAEIKEEVMVLQRELLDFKKDLINMITPILRPIIIEELPKALDMWLALEEE